jgi:hypothetical protein
LIDFPLIPAEAGIHAYNADIPYSSGWGYYPGGTLGLILIIVIILALIGRI